MKQFLTGLTAITAAVVIVILAYILYENSGELGLYKRSVLGIKEDYTRLQKEHTDYIDQTKNLRKLTIFAKSQDSKNVQIAEIINSYSARINGDLSIYYKNLTTNESIIVDADRKYYMASLYKVILTIFILDEIKKGTTTLNTKIGTSSATLETGLNKIITESNNEYAQILAEKYGWEEIEISMKQKLGIDFAFNQNFEANVKNIGLLFEDITLSLKVTSDETSYLLSLLGDQKKTSKLPKYLPASVYSHNKTGEFEQYSHDAGIFYTPKANYILVFMSRTPVPGITNEQMALMSKEIYETLNGIKDY